MKVKLLLIVLILFVYSCEYDFIVEPKLEQRGELISIDFVGNIKSDYLKSLIIEFNVGDELIEKLLYDIEVYKVIYTTLSYNEKLTKASGAIFIPKFTDNLPLLSIQHGTQTKKNNVGSINPYFAIEGLIGASSGYFSIVPDYLGLGESDNIHPYHHEKSSANVVIDFIRAAKIAANILNKKLNGQLFLIGYSEGGYVTLAAQKEIERYYSKEINITASAPMAGAYDLYLTSKIILKNKFYDQPSFLAFLIVAYNEIYGWNNINRVFNSPYAEKVVQLFDGTKTTSEINQELTKDLTKLFKPEFLDSFQNGTEKEFTQALIENSLINFVPKTPTRLYHGDSDEYVPYENSLRAKEYFNFYGANVELVTIKSGTHISSVLPSMSHALNWFEILRIKKVIAFEKVFFENVK